MKNLKLYKDSESMRFFERDHSETRERVANEIEGIVIFIGVLLIGIITSPLWVSAYLIALAIDKLKGKNIYDVHQNKIISKKEYEELLKQNKDLIV